MKTVTFWRHVYFLFMVCNIAGQPMHILNLIFYHLYSVMTNHNAPTFWSLLSVLCTLWHMWCYLVVVGGAVTSCAGIIAAFVCTCSSKQIYPVSISDLHMNDLDPSCYWQLGPSTQGNVEVTINVNVVIQQIYPSNTNVIDKNKCMQHFCLFYP